VAGNLFNYPPSSFGYYRGSPQAGGTGSGMGVSMAGNTSYAAGQGPSAGSNSGWHPSILYMFVLIIAEMFVFAFISKHL
jgi:hypothetical protein